VIAGTLGFAGLAQAYTAPPPPPGTPGIEPGTPFNADPNRPSLTEPGTGSTAMIHRPSAVHEARNLPLELL
jgi:hypothetical protein